MQTRHIPPPLPPLWVQDKERIVSALSCTLLLLAKEFVEYADNHEYIFGSSPFITKDAEALRDKFAFDFTSDHASGTHQLIITFDQSLTQPQQILARHVLQHLCVHLEGLLDINTMMSPLNPYTLGNNCLAVRFSSADEFLNKPTPPKPTSVFAATDIVSVEPLRGPDGTIRRS